MAKIIYIEFNGTEHEAEITKGLVGSEMCIRDRAYEPKSNSRLSCQLIVSDDLDGLTVHMPEKQV